MGCDWRVFRSYFEDPIPHGFVDETSPQDDELRMIWDSDEDAGGSSEFGMGDGVDDDFDGDFDDYGEDDEDDKDSVEDVKMDLDS